MGEEEVRKGGLGADGPTGQGYRTAGVFAEREPLIEAHLLLYYVLMAKHEICVKFIIGLNNNNSP